MPIAPLNPVQFCGDDERYRHRTGRLIYTPGVKYGADNGGQSEAYWLLDAIACREFRRDAASPEFALGNAQAR